MNTDRPVVKICGVRTPDSAIAVAAAGADLIGVNFAHVSKRRVDPQTARRIVDSLRGRGGVVAPLPSQRGRGWGGGFLRNGGGAEREWGDPHPPPGVVGIFVEQSPDTIAVIAREASLHAVQLSGDYTPAACIAVHDATGLPVIAVMRLGGAHDVPMAMALASSAGVVAVLVDAPGAVGGAGHAWDHAQARPVVEAVSARGVGVIVAGGLHEGNVRDALARSGAWGVDVASGVETAGLTDPARVAAFVRAAHSGFRAEPLHSCTSEVPCTPKALSLYPSPVATGQG